MGFIENFKKKGYRFKWINQQPKLSQREALKQIHQFLCSASVELGEPIEVRTKFEQIKVENYTDAQVKEILKFIATEINDYLITTQGQINQFKSVRANFQLEKRILLLDRLDREIPIIKKIVEPLNDYIKQFKSK